jgi:predicted anti-sigma-YlaC factor YlaD
MIMERNMDLRSRLVAISLALMMGLFASCSINRLAVRAVADTLTSSKPGSPSVFASDDDPTLIAEALPFALKTYEALLSADPGNAKLALATGSAFVTYANAFVQGPASMLPVDRLTERDAENLRAKKLYLRGRNYVLDGIEIRHPGFKASLDAGNAASPLAKMGKDDVPYLYWAAAGWVGAFSAEPMDFNLMAKIPVAASLMARAFALDPGYQSGAIYEFYISFYSGMPASLGGDRSKAEAMFLKAVEASRGRSASPYVSWAAAYCVPVQDIAAFRDALAKALAIDPEAFPENRLANLIAQKKARWYLDNLDSLFIDTGSD